MNNNCNYYGLLQNCELVVENVKIRKMFSVLNQYFMVILPYFLSKCYDIFIFCSENPKETCFFESHVMVCGEKEGNREGSWQHGLHKFR